MKKYLFQLVLVIAFVGCKSQQPIIKSDSVIVEYRDRIINIHDTVINEIQLPGEVLFKVATDSSHLETSRSSSDAKILDNGKILHTLTDKPFTITDTVYRDVPIHVTDTFMSESKVVIETVEKELNKWQTFRMKLGFVSLILLVSILGYKTYKFIK